MQIGFTFQENSVRIVVLTCSKVFSLLVILFTEYLFFTKLFTSCNFIFKINTAQVAQSVEQRTENPRVDSSILSLGTMSWLVFLNDPFMGFFILWAIELVSRVIV